ncbi:MAG: hypothetical protein NVSMB14_16920 [Isosphaeraceae bacterium]
MPRTTSLALWAILTPAVCATVAIAEDSKGKTQDAAPSQSAKPLKIPEGVEMLWAIVRGSDMGPNDGWFHPGQSRYSWKWLADRFDKNGDGAIELKEFQGPSDLFDRLDRDRDGAITADDLDWSDRSTYLRQSALASRMIARMDANSNGRVAKSEWDAFFDQLAQGKRYLVSEDLRRSFFTAPSRPKSDNKEKDKDAKPSSAPAALNDAPTPLTLLKGLVSGEVGSWSEGPALGAHAPDFSLKTIDGKEIVHLSDKLGDQPIVLIFGSFT